MAAVVNSIVHTLAPLFSVLLLATIMISGVLMMVAPEKGREMFKNAAIAAGLFLLGLTLAQACIQRLR